MNKKIDIKYPSIVNQAIADESIGYAKKQKIIVLVLINGEYLSNDYIRKLKYLVEQASSQNTQSKLLYKTIPQDIRREYLEITENFLNDEQEKSKIKKNLFALIDALYPPKIVNKLKDIEFNLLINSLFFSETVTNSPDFSVDQKILDYWQSLKETLSYIPSKKIIKAFKTLNLNLVSQNKMPLVDNMFNQVEKILLAPEDKTDTISKVKML